MGSVFKHIVKWAKEDKWDLFWQVVFILSLSLTTAKGFTRGEWYTASILAMIVVMFIFGLFSNAVSRQIPDFKATHTIHQTIFTATEKIDYIADLHKPLADTDDLTPAERQVNLGIRIGLTKATEAVLNLDIDDIKKNL